MHTDTCNRYRILSWENKYCNIQWKFKQKPSTNKMWKSFIKFFFLTFSYLLNPCLFHDKLNPFDLQDQFSLLRFYWLKYYFCSNSWWVPLWQFISVQFQADLYSHCWLLSAWLEEWKATPWVGSQISSCHFHIAVWPY